MANLKEILKRRLARAKGFTLVELLIVIMIIAILAGMLLLATGSSTDTAEAARWINDLRNVKSSIMIMAVEHGMGTYEFMELRRDDGQLWTMLNGTLDRPLTDIDNDGAKSHSINAIPGFATIDGVSHAFVGIVADPSWTAGISNGVKAKLKQQAQNVGLYTFEDDGDQAQLYDGESDHLFMIVD